MEASLKKKSATPAVYSPAELLRKLGCQTDALIRDAGLEFCGAVQGRTTYYRKPRQNVVKGQFILFNRIISALHTTLTTVMLCSRYKFFSTPPFMFFWPKSGTMSLKFGKGYVRCRFFIVGEHWLLRLGCFERGAWFACGIGLELKDCVIAILTNDNLFVVSASSILLDLTAKLVASANLARRLPLQQDSRRHSEMEALVRPLGILDVEAYRNQM